MDRHSEKYEDWIRKQFNDAHAPELKTGKHFRRWILILYEGDETINPQLGRIRRRLNENRMKYQDFAMSMQRLYSLYSKDIHGNIFNLKYLNRSNVPEYVNLLDDEIKMGVSIFVETEVKQVSE